MGVTELICDFQQSKLLGGDLEHTHMVKGLDYTLLEKMKTTADSSDEDEEREEVCKKFTFCFIVL